VYNKTFRKGIEKQRFTCSWKSFHLKLAHALLLDERDLTTALPSTPYHPSNEDRGETNGIDIGNIKGARGLAREE
jgi:hypothetical protein